MAITTLDGVVAGMLPPYELLKIGATMEAAGIYWSSFYSAGQPGAAVAPSPGIGGAALTTYAGQIPFINPASGNTYLARLEAASTASGALLLCDRLWHNSGIGITTTTGQTVNSAAWPARCPPASGSTPDTNGGSILVGIEVSTVTGNGSPVTNTTLTYTDQSGNSGATGTMASFPATGVAGTFVPFALASGDTGIRSVQTLTLGTSYVSGTIHLVAYRVLARVGIPIANVSNAVDALTAGFPRLYDNTVPFLLWMPTATTAVNITGSLIYTQG
jgi:hypothetical protein